MVAAAIAIPLQILAGDLHGLNTLEHQPAKIAAIEGIWHTEKSAPLTLFGWPNEKEGRTDYALQVPKLASLILAHDLDAELKGLNEFKGAHPPVAPVFWGFRVMVGMGLLMLAVSWWAAWTLWRRPAAAAPTAPLLALAVAPAVGHDLLGLGRDARGLDRDRGGRQPSGLRAAAHGRPGRAAPAGMVLATLLAYLAVYVFLLGAYVRVLMYMAQHPAMPTPETPQSPRPPCRGRPA